MRRFLHFSILVAALLAIAVAMGMGAGSVAAQDADNSTSDDDDGLGLEDLNESAREQIDGLLGSDDGNESDDNESDDGPAVHSILDRTDGENATDVQVETVTDWYDDERDELNESQRDRVDSWLAAAPEPDDDAPANYSATIDSETWITDWEYRDGQFVVDIYALEDTTVTMAESADWEEGEGEYRRMVQDIDEGEQTIYVQTFADDSDGVALAFATELGMEQERGPYISTGTEAAEDPFRHFGGTSGLFSGVGMTTMLAGLGAWIVVRQEESGVIEA